MNNKIDNRAIANIRGSTRQAVGIILIRRQVVAPCLAPERLRNVASLDLNRGWFTLLLLRKSSGLLCGLV